MYNSVHTMYPRSSRNTLRNFRAALTASLLSCVSTLAASPVKAELTIDFYNNFGGATPTGTSNPLLTAIIKNVTRGGVDGADIQLESFLEPPSNTEYVEQISFYLTSPLPQGINLFTENTNCFVNSGFFSCTGSDFKTDSNLNQPDFNPTDPKNAINAVLNLPTGGGTGTEPTGSLVRFDANDKGTFFIAGLTEQMFLTFSALDNSNPPVAQTLYAGAKINSIACANGVPGSCSTSIGGSRRQVPAPLPVLGAVAAYSFSRRLRRQIGKPKITV